VHRILDAYAEVADVGVRSGATVGGYTSREVEDRFRIREAHKRTSELLVDGLLEVVRVPANPGEWDDTIDLERGGGRVLRITDAGRRELARLNAAQTRRNEIAADRATRRRQREERLASRTRVKS
jgi:hypothetical protein